jgi:hypothetical protein
MGEIASIYAARIKRRLLIGCISALIGVPIMGCCVLLLPTVVFPALDSIAAAGGAINSGMVIIAAGILALIGIPLVLLVGLTIRRTRDLNAVFTPMGLTGKPFMVYGRHYQGQIGGREVDVYIYRGPTVEIRLKTAVRTRLQVIPKGSISTVVAGMFARDPLATGSPSLDAFSIYPLDPAWTLGLLAVPRAVEAIRGLMTLGASWAILRRVEIQPGEVLLCLNRSHKIISNSIDLSAVQGWLDALESLAEVVESQPLPRIPAEPVEGSSRASRQRKSNFLTYSVAFIVFVFPLCLIGIGVFAYLIVTLLK